jgi:hypothetical protein
MNYDELSNLIKFSYGEFQPNEAYYYNKGMIFASESANKISRKETVQLYAKNKEIYDQMN